jgi:hypothetical protein
VVHFKNRQTEIPAGGHLQGIQAIDTKGGVLAITASSSGYSYMITVNLQNEELLSVSKLLDSPYRHAGGCQAIGSLLIVGIEDNIAKDKSKIVAVQLTGAGSLKNTRVLVNRQGYYKRSTAGAVGAINTNDGRRIVVAGDWDSKNIDCYAGTAASDSLYPVNTLVAPAGSGWPSFQSINLVADTAGRLFMVGFSLDRSKNRADLFELDFSGDTFSAKLIYTRYFKCLGKASFRYAAGIGSSAENGLCIYATQRNVIKYNTINIFSGSMR